MRRSPAHVLLAAAIGTAALLLGSCGGSGDGDAATSTSGPATTTTTEVVYADLDASDIAFHPVLAIVGCDGGDVPGATVATTATIPSSTVPAVDGQLCYVLGPEGGNGSQVRDAKVYADGVGIEVSVREDDVASMNLMFNACYLAIAACPASSAEGKGYVAIVVDGKVVSTPAIDAEDLASSPFVITGDFDQQQATDIAAAINAP